MPQVAHFIVLFLLCLSSSHKISLVAAAEASEISAHKKFGTIASKVGTVNHAHFAQGNVEGSFLQVQSLHSESETNPNGDVNQFSDQFDSTPTPPQPVVRSDEDEESGPRGTTATPIDDSSLTTVASKTIPNDENRPASPFDHYHILGTRPGSHDSTLEKRRVCPAQPLPSNRGCKCPDQTICKIGNHRTCVQLNHDHENCGSCSLRCGTTQYCQGGKCHCERPNFSACGKSCYNLKNNEEHCGKCGVVCGRGKSCVKGTCKRE